MDILNDPTPHELLTSQLRSLESHGTDEYRKALQEVEQEPQSAEAWFNLGCALDGMVSMRNLLLSQLAMLEAAVDDHDGDAADGEGHDSCEGCSCHPDDDAPLVLDDKAVELYQRALESYDKVLSLDPSYYGVHCQKGLILSYQQRNDEAVAAFLKAIEADEDYSAAYYLGHLYKEMGDEALADKYLAMAQEGEDSIEDLEKW